MKERGRRERRRRRPDTTQGAAGELNTVSGHARRTVDPQIRTVDFRGILQRPAWFFLQVGLMHTVHHRGQLSTYLRPMGGKVPAIYGESYDSAEAKKAAQTVA